MTNITPSVSSSPKLSPAAFIKEFESNQRGLMHAQGQYTARSLKANIRHIAYCGRQLDTLEIHMNSLQVSEEIRNEFRIMRITHRLLKQQVECAQWHAEKAKDNDGAVCKKWQTLSQRLPAQLGQISRDNVRDLKKQFHEHFVRIPVYLSNGEMIRAVLPRQACFETPLTNHRLRVVQQTNPHTKADVREVTRLVVELEAAKRVREQTINRFSDQHIYSGQEYEKARQAVNERYQKAQAAFDYRDPKLRDLVVAYVPIDERGVSLPATPDRGQITERWKSLASRWRSQTNMAAALQMHGNARRERVREKFQRMREGLLRLAGEQRRNPVYPVSAEVQNLGLKGVIFIEDPRQVDENVKHALIQLIGKYYIANARQDVRAAKTALDECADFARQTGLVYALDEMTEQEYQVYNDHQLALQLQTQNPLAGNGAAPAARVPANSAASQQRQNRATALLREQEAAAAAMAARLAAQEEFLPAGATRAASSFASSAPGAPFSDRRSNAPLYKEDFVTRPSRSASSSVAGRPSASSLQAGSASRPFAGGAGVRSSASSSSATKPPGKYVANGASEAKSD